MGKNKLYFSASVSTLDLMNLQKQIDEVENAGFDFLHYDMVDGIYNDCFILGDTLIPQLKQNTRLPIEVHLAFENPEKYLERIVQMGVDYIAVHYESLANPMQTLDYIENLGATPILAFKANTEVPANFIELAHKVPWILKLSVNPGYAGQKFQPTALKHIREMSQIIKNNNFDTLIQADGNISPSTIHDVIPAGGRILTYGTSSVFNNKESITKNFDSFRNKANEIMNSTINLTTEMS